MKKIIVTGLLLTYISFSCTENKVIENSKTNENQEIIDDSIYDETFKIDLLASQIQAEMKRFSQTLEEEIYELKVQREKLTDHQQRKMDQSIQELQGQKDIFNKKLGELDPNSGVDQSKVLLELDSITAQIQSKIASVKIN